MLLRYLGSPFSLFMLGLRLGDWRPQLNIRSTSYVRNCLESLELEGLVESDLTEPGLYGLPSIWWRKEED